MDRALSAMVDRLRLIASLAALEWSGADAEDLEDPVVRAAAIRADHP
jgi:hypothetical protein